MKNEMLTQFNDPRSLEKLYRNNKPLFRRTFSSLYPQLKGQALADFWYERLHYQSEEINWGTRRELLFVVIASVLAGLIAKLPAILGIEEDFFYARNIGFIVFPALTAFFVRKNKTSTRNFAFIAGAFLVAVVFINFLPDVPASDTLILSCIHLLLFLWLLLGFSFVSAPGSRVENRLAYLKYNGDLLVLTALILISGAIVTAMTIGLFSLIGFN